MSASIIQLYRLVDIEDPVSIPPPPVPFRSQKGCGARSRRMAWGSRPPRLVGAILLLLGTIGVVWNAPFTGKRIVQTQTVPSETSSHTDRARALQRLLLVQGMALELRSGLASSDAPDGLAHRLGVAT
jgi:hypothetical protein